MDVITFSVVLVGVGASLWAIARFFIEGKKSPEEIFVIGGALGEDTVNDKVPIFPSPTDARASGNHPTGMPEIPAALAATGYEGWFSEAVKRLQLQSYQRTQAERLAGLRQIRELQVAFLDIAKGKADWQKLPQEDKLRQMRLDIEEIELEIKKAELYEKRAALEKRKDAKAAPPPRRRSVQERVLEMKTNQARDHSIFANDPELQGVSDRKWDDRILRAMEEDGE